MAKIPKSVADFNFGQDDTQKYFEANLIKLKISRKTLTRSLHKYHLKETRLSELQQLKNYNTFQYTKTLKQICNTKTTPQGYYHLNSKEVKLNFK